MPDMAYRCRSCGEGRLTPVLSLGRTPLANALLTHEDLDRPEPTYPLELVFCPRCALVQITETVAPEELFEEYAYFSSFSETMLRHAQILAERVVRERRLGPASLVGEVASNDGYLLQNYQRHGVPVLGIEPARNIARVAQERGIPTLCEFFGLALAQRLAAERRRADVVHAHNVLAHVPDLNGFVAGIETLLADDGVAVIEAPYVRDLVDHVEFDTIYHEHLCYFSLTALDRLFARHGLLITGAERVPIHGGSLRLLAQPARSTPASVRADAVKALLDEEAVLGVAHADYYRDFAARVERLRRQLVAFLADLKAKGSRIAAYGASAKGATLLNYFGVGRETLDFVVDRSTVKQGRYTPGTHLRIFSPEKLMAEKPDYVLLLTWNFAEEILAQQAAYRRQGGRFILPIPEVKVA